MAKPGIEELLIRCVLDPQLLQQLRESPEGAFDDYELSERAREILSSPDERLLELLGEAIGHSANRHPTEESEERDQPVAPINEPQSSSTTTLPASRLALRLVPYAQQAPASSGEAASVIVNYAGHLDPLPEGVELDDLPGVPAAVTDGQQLPALSVVVRVQPTVWTDGAGNQQLSFSVRAQLPQIAAEQGSGKPDEVRLSPWRHDVDSVAVNSAAERVKEAGASDRYEYLRALIDVMTSPADSAGEAR